MTEEKRHPTGVSGATPVAVVGMTAIYPGEPGLEGYWRTITGGRDAISDVPPSHWLIEDYYDADPHAPDKTYAKRGGFLPDVQFDPMEFGVPPSIVPATDTAQLLALMVAQRTLEDATGGDIASLDKERVSTLMGRADFPASAPPIETSETVRTVGVRPAN